MPLSLKLLLVEDSPHDAELTLLTLENSGLKIDATLVYNHQEVERELLAQRFDLSLLYRSCAHHSPYPVCFRGNPHG